MPVAKSSFNIRCDLHQDVELDGTLILRCVHIGKLSVTEMKRPSGRLYVELVEHYSSGRFYVRKVWSSYMANEPNPFDEYVDEAKRVSN